MHTSQLNSPERNLRIAAGLMALGSICPWATALGLASVSGVELRIGWLTLLSGLAILTFSLDPGWLGRFPRIRGHRRRITRVLSTLCVLGCLLIAVGIGGAASGGVLQASWGCYLTLLASVGAGVWAPARPPGVSARR